ncbi:glycosyltransferase [Shewanella bicestrii]|uniref:glycosyltransferase n=1 Tax=Aeromonas caviae TaxID=648 RepID=UPI002B482CC6|nr:glycosyltransferase [Aeromonas caviae]
MNKISIITLTYKNWHLLDKAIASVASQIINEKYEVEYLIVDDGTPDFNIEYVTGLLASTHLNYRVIVNPENMGTVASFNNAIQQSTGDIIVPLSADDEFYDTTVVNDIAEEFNRTGAYIITGLRVPVVGGKESPPLPKLKDLVLFSDKTALLKQLLVHQNIISGASTYYQKNIFHKVGYFDESYRLLEDYPFYIRALTLGIEVALFKRKTIKYGMDGISSSGQINPILRNDFNLLHSKAAISEELSNSERKLVVYTKLMNKNKKLLYILKYPKQFMYVLFKKIKIALFNDD